MIRSIGVYCYSLRQQHEIDLQRLLRAILKYDQQDSGEGWT
jgi:hypothetical protein